MDWFKHDIAAQQDIKIKKLIRKYGYEGYGLYWHAIELLYQHNGSISIKDMEDEFDLCGNDSFPGALAELGLIEIEGEFYTCKRVSAEIKKTTDLFNKKSEAGKKGNEIRWQNHRSAIAEVSQCDCIAIAEGSHTNRTLSQAIADIELDKELEIKEKEIKEKENEVSSETELPSETPFITLPTNKRQIEYPVFPSQIEELKTLYPAVNVEQEFRGMRAWLISNARLRKTSGGMPRFINNWLSRSQDNYKQPKSNSRQHMITDAAERSIGVDENGFCDLRKFIQ